jgi:predicted DNA-binding transcriptional regulator AlpA
MSKRPLLARYADLEREGICRSRQDLKNKIDRLGFPPGFMLSANCRAWRWVDVEAWFDSRPIKHPKPAQPWKAAKAARGFAKKAGAA